MKTHAMRAGGIIVLALLVEACTRVGHIQQAQPVRTMTFPGNHNLAANCARVRLGAKLSQEGSGRAVVYNTAKGGQLEGVSHYSVTFGLAGKGSYAELRTLNNNATSGQTADPTPAIDELWKAVQACAAEAKTVD